MRLRSSPHALLLCACLVVPVTASAQSSNVGKRVSLPAQPMCTALQAIARRFAVDLLFSGDVVGDRRAPAVSGVLTVEQALAQLLAGSGLVAHGSADSGYAITLEPPRPSDAEGASGPDILVVGRRTQNVDIRRRANDVQPYQVVTRQDVRTSHAATVEELMGKRISQDARGLSFAQAPISGQGSPHSMLDLRGLGTDQTLVLLDGRRLPRLPGRRLAFLQPDVNAISPEAIDRAEVITSTAGGIYGPGALAGVVNIVLARDYRGADVAVTRGVTARGDAPFGRIDARLGFTPDSGATDVMLSYSRSSTQGLRVGDRDFRARADARAFGTNPAYYRTGDLPLSNSTNVASASGMPLVLKSGYGGAALGSWLTTLPAGDGRSNDAIGAALLANAGTLDFTPASTSGGAWQSLSVDRASSAVLANIRHRFAAGLEVYADLVRLVDRGRVTSGSGVTGVSLAADDPRNPFLQAVDVSFPIAAWGGVTRQRIAITRASFGAVVSLPEDWKANIDYSLGSARQRLALSGTTYDLDGFIDLLGLRPDGSNRFDPFGDSTTLRAALSSASGPVASSSQQTNRLHDASIRLSGPVARLPGGPLVATVLFEERRERVGASTDVATLLGQTVSEPLRGHSERVRSVYVELRAPIVAEDAAFGPLRGLEVQLAARNDATRVTLGPDPNDDPSVVYDRLTSAARAATLFTLGFKVKPLPGLLVRGSVATGEMSPPLSEIADYSVNPFATDAKRGGRLLGSEAPFDFIVFGNKITPERARSISTGIIATPFGDGGASLSIDFTRIRRSREVDGRLVGSALSFLFNEDLYPGRVTRLPLTPADAALGYTGGIITRVDTSYLTLGRTAIDAVDAHLAIPIPTAHAGEFAVVGSATWQPRYRRFVLPSDPVENLVSQASGALEWRGNAGVEWNRGPMMMSLNGQYYGSYHVTSGTIGSDLIDVRNIGRQGGNRIAAQLTFDVAAAYRLALDGGARPRSLELRFGIQDLLDHRPAIFVAGEGGYSYYADARRHRFDLTAAISF